MLKVFVILCEQIELNFINYYVKYMNIQNLNFIKRYVKYYVNR